jgi:hypothetical protein
LCSCRYAGYSLRAVARILAAAGSRRVQNELRTMLQLVRAMAGIADVVAQLREAQQRLHQAEAARTAAAHLSTYQPPAVPFSGAQHADQPATAAAGVTTLSRPAQMGRSRPRGR